jgi:hypothetical protein
MVAGGCAGWEDLGNPKKLPPKTLPCGTSTMHTYIHRDTKTLKFLS